MALFGEAWPRAAVLGPEPVMRAPTGMFGSPAGRSTRYNGGMGTSMLPIFDDPLSPQPNAQQSSVLAAFLGQQPTSRGTFTNDVSSLAGDTQRVSTGLDRLAPLLDLSNVQLKRPGFFQHGGFGEKILHGLGELGLRYSAGQGDPYATMVLRNRFEQQEQQARSQDRARQRQEERDEWMRREQWKREHPDDQFTQYMQAAGIDPTSPQGQALYRQRAESMAAPPLMAVDGFDAQGNPTKTFMPRTGLSGVGGQSASSGPAPGTIRNGYRFNGGNPNDRNSWVPVGGASSSGGATFRR